MNEQCAHQVFNQKQNSADHSARSVEHYYAEHKMHNAFGFDARGIRPDVCVSAGQADPKIIVCGYGYKGRRLPWFAHNQPPTGLLLVIAFAARAHPSRNVAAGSRMLTECQPTESEADRAGDQQAGHRGSVYTTNSSATLPIVSGSELRGVVPYIGCSISRVP